MILSVPENEATIKATIKKPQRNCCGFFLPFFLRQTLLMPSESSSIFLLVPLVYQYSRRAVSLR